MQLYKSISKIDAFVISAVAIGLFALTVKSKVNVAMDAGDLMEVIGVLEEFSDGGSVRGHFRDSFEISQSGKTRFLVPVNKKNSEILKKNVGNMVTVRYQYFYDSGILSIRKNLARSVLLESGEVVNYRMLPYSDGRVKNWMDGALYFFMICVSYLALKIICIGKNRVGNDK